MKSHFIALGYKLFKPVLDAVQTHSALKRLKARQGLPIVGSLCVGNSTEHILDQFHC